MTLKRKLVGLVAGVTVSGLAALGAGTAQAAEDLTWSYATASVGSCYFQFGLGCGPRVDVRTETFYGPNMENNASVYPQDYKPPGAVMHLGSAFAWAETGDDPLGLPSLHASAFGTFIPTGAPGIGVNSVNYATAVGVQGFQNTTDGQLVIPLNTFEGAFHYLTGGPLNTLGVVGASLALTTGAILDPGVATEWFRPKTGPDYVGAFAATCDTDGALAIGYSGAQAHFSTSPTTPYESRSTVGVTGCDGATAFTLDAGESFYIWARLTVVKGGPGFVDAGNTFNVQFSPEAVEQGLDQQLGVQLAAATDLVAPEVPGVPEPATWAMMILGFGAAGGILRRRRPQIA